MRCAAQLGARDGVPVTSSSGAQAALDDQELRALMADPEWVINHVKVDDCPKTHQHDFTGCAFAHPGERARRRDPARLALPATLCEAMKRDNFCPQGDDCCLAHNLFEYFLHSSRFRTKMCELGPACSRKICFFAHSRAELRTPPTGRQSSGAKPAKPRRQAAWARPTPGAHCCRPEPLRPAATRPGASEWHGSGSSSSSGGSSTCSLAAWPINVGTTPAPAAAVVVPAAAGGSMLPAAAVRQLCEQLLALSPELRAASGGSADLLLQWLGGGASAASSSAAASDGSADAALAQSLQDALAKLLSEAAAGQSNAGAAMSPSPPPGGSIGLADAQVLAPQSAAAPCSPLLQPVSMRCAALPAARVLQVSSPAGSAQPMGSSCCVAVAGGVDASTACVLADADLVLLGSPDSHAYAVGLPRLLPWQHQQLQLQPAAGTWPPPMAAGLEGPCMLLDSGDPRAGLAPVASPVVAAGASTGALQLLQLCEPGLGLGPPVPASAAALHGLCLPDAGMSGMVAPGCCFATHAPQCMPGLQLSSMPALCQLSMPGLLQ